MRTQARYGQWSHGDGLHRRRGNRQKRAKVDSLTVKMTSPSSRSPKKIAVNGDTLAETFETLAENAIIFAEPMFQRQGSAVVVRCDEASDC